MIRERDIFRFSYSAERRAKLFEPSHCFDGQLVAVKCGDQMILMDTYWLYQFKPGSDSRCFTEAEALEQGELTFVCNLDDVVKIEKWQVDYYDDRDVFNISYQHGCYPYYVLKKDATRSREKMRRVIADRIKDEERKVMSAVSAISRLSQSMEMVESGRINEAWI